MGLAYTQLLLHLGKEKHVTKSIILNRPAKPKSQGTKRFEQYDSTKEESTYSLLPPKEMSALILN